MSDASLPIFHRYEHDREHDWESLERFADLATRAGTCGGGQAGMTNVVASVYRRFAADRGLPAAKLAAHPSEGQIARESIAEQRPRLRKEIGAAQPKVNVTLAMWPCASSLL